MHVFIITYYNKYIHIVLCYIIYNIIYVIYVIQIYVHINKCNEL